MSEKVLPTILLALLALLIFWAMWKGWQGRKGRQLSETANLPEVPASFDNREALLAVEGIYVSTTSQGDWLDRIAAHGLGLKSQASCLVYEQGLILVRQGAADLWIPAQDFLGVRTESGMAGKFVEKDGLLVISWSLEGRALDTGFRTRYAADQQPLLEALSSFCQPRQQGFEPAP